MKHLEVPIGRNCSIDGGPFVNFRGLGNAGDHPDGGVHGRDDNGYEEAVSLERIEDVLQGEMLAGEPIGLNTGDVYDDDVGEKDRVGTIKLPLAVGFMVEPHGLGDGVWLLPNLTGYQRRQMVEHRLRTKGGTIQPSGR